MHACNPALLQRVYAKDAALYESKCHDLLFGDPDFFVRVRFANGRSLTCAIGP